MFWQGDFTPLQNTLIGAHSHWLPTLIGCWSDTSFPACSFWQKVNWICQTSSCTHCSNFSQFLVNRSIFGSSVPSIKFVKLKLSSYSACSFILHRYTDSVSNIMGGWLCGIPGRPAILGHDLCELYRKLALLVTIALLLHKHAFLTLNLNLHVYGTIV